MNIRDVYKIVNNEKRLLLTIKEVLHKHTESIVTYKVKVSNYVQGNNEWDVLVMFKLVDSYNKEQLFLNFNTRLSKDSTYEVVRETLEHYRFIILEKLLFEK